ncbi:Arc family DNA-binding protein [Agrobacterium tumefaciens]|uniref:Arc family DNA-binding protein n=1 Tax=Agrobacterium tumefaciens TaxID=358 RepID=A0AA44F198_AGRTU|nr:Arc family DNA-binding protein [Agrobacterium tumefaciens]NSL22890.1 Arc family DNA-binding protein [Agrobacterium tumefaciens]NTB84102.1 Arc family DNA-binding protein [Agrobacterium tumefaciens]NTC20203.1 Arc family DNA-binding protein [Agrobacterium tumefaciens]NTC27406.1 Arc family DNA-binding protein [Agrobacterium tumefaciens]NTC56723.1 Arc family DNA-binding protein [Agrobacterium tumefaciens]
MAQVQFKLNLPHDIKEWLEEKARQNLRSQNSEVILALREKINRETQKADAQA